MCCRLSSCVSDWVGVCCWRRIGWGVYVMCLHTCACGALVRGARMVDLASISLLIFSLSFPLSLFLPLYPPSPCPSFSSLLRSQPNQFPKKHNTNESHKLSLLLPLLPRMLPHSLPLPLPTYLLLQEGGRPKPLLTRAHTNIATTTIITTLDHRDNSNHNKSLS